MKRKYIEAFMDMTERFGQTSEATRLKVGAMLVRNGHIVAQGVNGQPPGWPTEVCEDENNVTLPTVRHAEIAAFDKLLNLKDYIEDSDIYISHAPCLECSKKIVDFGISKVYYRHSYRKTDGIDYLQSKGVDVEKVD
jgi:dCMP deaminase